MIKWNKKSKPETVLLKLEEIYDPLEGGARIYSQMGVYNDCCETLLFMIDSDYKNYHFIKLSFKNSISRYLKEVECKSERSKLFISILKDESNKINRANENYEFHSALSHPPYIFPSEVLIDDVIIKFNEGDYQKEVRSSIEKYQNSYNFWWESFEDDLNYESNYTAILSTCEAINISEAKYKFDRSIYILRAIYALFVNFSFEYFNTNEFTPINRLVRSKYCTLNGFLYFEPRSFIPSTFEMPEKIPVEEKFYDCLSKIEAKEAKYSKILKDSLVKFCRALDEFDSNICMVKIWSALEDLLSMENENNKEKMVNRFKSINGGDEHSFQTLEQIRLLRNKYVHECFLLENVRKKCFVLSQSYKKALFFHLDDRFSNFEECIGAMDLLSNLDDFESLKKTAGIVDSILDEKKFSE